MVESLIQIRLREIINQTALKFDLSHELILSRRRDRPYPEARRFIAKELRKFGYSYPEIGKAMNRDHTSIMFMVDENFREKKMKQNRERHYAKI